MKLKKLNVDFYLIGILLLALIGCIIFTGHYDRILIDFGREIYYPERILQGKVLYKDLFNIYGPFSYLMNALLYKCFGTNLYTLYAAGTILALTLTGFIYKIADLFLSKIQSFAIGFFTIAVGICTTVIFNFTFPYSWGMLYGTAFFSVSLYYLLKSIDNNANYHNIFRAALFAGLAVSNKYEFIPYGFLILFYILKARKNIAFSICTFFAPIAISYGILFLQGLTFNQLAGTLSIVKIMSKTQTLKYFYVHSGIFFHHEILLIDAVSLFIIFMINGLYFLALKSYNKNKFLSAVLIIIPILATFFIKPETSFIYLPLLLITIFVIQFRKISDKKIFYLVISAILLSLKSIWALLIFSYGTYYVSFLIIAIMALFNQYWKKSVSIFLCCISILFLIQASFNFPSSLISTDKGKIYTNKADALNNITAYFKNVPPQTKVVFLPEGMTLNFLTKTQSDDFYNSFIPLYIETFSEKTLIEHYQKSAPEYFVFANLNMLDYGYKYLCEDFALNFCHYVIDNYNLEEKYSDDKNTFLIYKKK